MARLKESPYGSWKSPITSNLIASDSIEIGQIEVDGDDVYWVEVRPREGGRSVLVRHTLEGQSFDVTPSSFNVRTRVHEYGGGAFAVSNGTIYFSNFADQRVYCQESQDHPYPITPEGDFRYADGVIDENRARMICVREDHSVQGQEPVNSLVSLDLERCGEGVVLTEGNDFYSSPRISPDGTSLSWLTWNHPNMPWDGSELWVSRLKADGSLGRSQIVAGGLNESICQPQWSPDGVLHFVSDRNGWWNLFRWRGGQVERLREMEAEFGKPQWVFGMVSYAFESAEHIVCTYAQQGCWYLARLDTATSKLEIIDSPYTEMSRGDVCAIPGYVIFSGGSSAEPFSVIRLHLATGQLNVLRRSSEVVVDESYLSGSRSIEFPTGQGMTAHAFFYPPKNPDYVAPASEKAPMLVTSHGGPTGSSSTSLDLRIQYWTSRGIAVLDVNYGGSSGYGTEYRRRINGQWGVVDVDDCVNGALYLVERGEVDGDRLAIRGSSAGGYTTLSALTFRNVFKVGASYYGISDLEALAKETHKFEARYLDTMIGPYPEQRDLYVQRSPINYTEQLSCPVVLFQGVEDMIVLPAQAEMMVEALKKKELPVVYVAFEGEQHGFRRAENVKRALEIELYFYSQILGFEPAGSLESVFINNL